MNVYVLTRITVENNDETRETVGVFSTEEKVKSVLRQMTCRFPENFFSFEEFELDDLDTYGVDMYGGFDDYYFERNNEESY